jgi:hypothetical protein
LRIANCAIAMEVAELRDGRPQTAHAAAMREALKGRGERRSLAAAAVLPKATYVYHTRRIDSNTRRSPIGLIGFVGDDRRIAAFETKQKYLGALTACNLTVFRPR